MPNRMTRVPAGPPPDLGGAARLLLPLADAFMLLMVSRPATGSLRRTWVTPATLGLCAVVFAGSVAAAAVMVASGGTWRLVAAAGLALLAAGSGAVLAVGADQRRARPPR